MYDKDGDKMERSMKSRFGGKSKVYWGRLAIAFFAILIAATHLSSAIPSGSFAGGASTSHTTGTTGTSTAGATTPPMQQTLPLLPLWIDIEVIVYVLVAMVYLLGIRTWYAAATVFNAFNLGIYLLSGLIAIPGITGNPFGSHLSIISPSFVSTLLSLAGLRHS